MLLLLLLVLARGIEWYETHLGPKKSQREKGYVSSCVSRSLLPSYYTLLTMKMPSCILEIAVPGTLWEHRFRWFFSWLCTDSDRIQQAILSAFRLSPQSAIGVRLEGATEGCQPTLSGSRPHVEDSFYFNQSRGEELFPTSLEM